jgi:transcriptional regulator with XRE-family HTH domain
MKPLKVKLKELREGAGLSQDQMAALMLRPQAQHQSRIYKFENGISKPLPIDLLSYARHFRVPLEYLYDDAIDRPEDAGALGALTGEWRIIVDLVTKIGFERAIDRLIGPTQAHGGESAPADAGPLPELPRAERTLLAVAQRLGFDDALGRLLKVADPPAEPTLDANRVVSARREVADVSPGPPAPRAEEPGPPPQPKGRQGRPRKRKNPEQNSGSPGG